MKKSNQEKTLKKGKSVFFDANLKKLVIVTLVIFGFMAVMNPQMFFTKQNMMSMLFQLPELGFFALAMTFVIISGGIDLSVVSIANLSGICAAFIMRDAAERGVEGFELAMLIALVFVIAAAIGVVTGAINGWLISKFRISPILATLGTMNLYTGIGIIITKAKSISGFPDAYMQIGTGKFLGLPISLFMFIAAIAVSSVILNKTKYGFDLKFYGSNSKASLFAGINNKMLILKTYIYSGVMCAIVGLEFISRTNSAKADYGASYIFSAILCAILGGINPEGGNGKLGGIILALISLQLFSSGFNMLRFAATTKDMAWGILLIGIMSANHIMAKKQQKRKLY